MGFLDELKRRLMQQEGQHPPLVMNDPGISGRDTRPSDVITGVPQQPTPNPTPQVPITRPRAVMDNVRTAVAQPQQQMSQVQQPVAQPVATMRNDVPEATRDRRTQPRDYVADDEAYLRDLRNKPRNWKDKVVDALDAVNAGVGGQRRILPTKRERDIGETENRIGEGIKIASERARIEQGEMVPFQLPDGTWSIAPKRSVGGLQSRQQGQQATITERKRMNDAHIARWQGMTKREAATDAQRLYNSGAADDNDDLKDEIIGRMGLPPTTRLPNHDKGQVVVDANGNYVLANQKTAEARPLTQPSEAGPQPVGAMAGTAEAGRNRRFNQGQQGMNQRAANAQAGANQRAGMRGGGQGVTTDKTALRRAAQLAGQIEAVRKDLEAYDARTPANERNETIRKQKADKAAAAITELNNLGAGYEAGMGTGGYPYQKQTQQGASDLDRPIVGTPTADTTNYAGRRISKAKLPEFARRHGMTVEQAAQFLQDKQAVIY